MGDLKRVLAGEKNLQDANLRGANLRGASLWGANLQGANLQGANLWDANLWDANLRGASLQSANLHTANLHTANLRGANLWGAYLWGANLQSANLWGAYLHGANLQSANLVKTCLDPENYPNSNCRFFEREKGGFVLGFRTEKAGHIDKYRVGRFYSADVFSTCTTECHPGLYLWPSLADAVNYSSTAPLIVVRTKAVDVHKAGDKYRCRWFEVLRKV